MDDSGLYDPKEERREILRRQIKKMSKRKTHRRESIATFRVDVDKVQSITGGEQNWPDNWSTVSEEADGGKRKIIFRRNTPDMVPQVEIDDPGCELDDLTGHPTARSCKPCRVKLQRCSAMINGALPCDQCIEAGKEMACERIQEFPTGYKRADLDLLYYGPNRKYASCTACRLNKRTCSLKKKTDKPPCRACIKADRACRFESAAEVHAQAEAAAQAASNGPNSAVRMTRGDVQRNLNRMIDLTLLSSDPESDMEPDESASRTRHEITDAAGHHHGAPSSRRRSNTRSCFTSTRAAPERKSAITARSRSTASSATSNARTSTCFSGTTA